MALQLTPLSHSSYDELPAHLRPSALHNDNNQQPTQGGRVPGDWGVAHYEYASDVAAVTFARGQGNHPAGSTTRPPITATAAPTNRGGNNAVIMDSAGGPPPQGSPTDTPRLASVEPGYQTIGSLTSAELHAGVTAEHADVAAAAHAARLAEIEAEIEAQALKLAYLKAKKQVSAEMRDLMACCDGLDLLARLPEPVCPHCHAEVPIDASLSTADRRASSSSASSYSGGEFDGNTPQASRKNSGKRYSWTRRGSDREAGSNGWAPVIASTAPVASTHPEPMARASLSHNSCGGCGSEVPTSLSTGR